MSLALIALLACLPFLQPIHRLPLASFYEEWLAIVLGLLAVTSVAFARGPVAIPSTVLAPALLGLVALLQWAFGLAPLGEFVALHAAYFAWAGLLATGAATLVLRHGRPALFQALASGVLLGALACTVLVVLQRLNVRLPLEIMFPSSRPVANVAQPNELTSYLWLGLLGSAFLWRSGRLGWRTTLVMVAILGAAIGLAGSRMALVQAGALGGTLALLWWRGNDRDMRLQQARLLFVAIVAGALAPPAFDEFVPRAAGGTHSVLDRLSQVGLRGDPRLDLWRDTTTLIAEQPFTGNGAGNFPWRMVEAAAKAPPGAETYPGAEHSHNIVLQFAADFGLPVTLLLLAGVAMWLLRLAEQQCNEPSERDARDFGIGVLIVFGIHSMLEYPLWQAECLGLVFLFAGALDPVILRRHRAPSRGLATLVASAMTAMLLSIFLDYRAIDDAANRPLDATEAGWRKRVDSVVRLAKTSPLKPYAYIALSALLTPETSRAADQSLICEQAMRVWPDPLIITKCAILRCMTGRSDEARQLMDTLRAAFRDPGRQSVIREGIEVFAKKTPEASGIGGCGLDEAGGISSRQGP